MNSDWYYGNNFCSSPPLQHDAVGPFCQSGTSIPCTWNPKWQPPTWNPHWSPSRFNFNCKTRNPSMMNNHWQPSMGNPDESFENFNRPPRTWNPAFDHKCSGPLLQHVDYSKTRPFAVDPTVFDEESPGIDLYYPSSGVGTVVPAGGQVIVNTHVIMKLPKGIIGVIMDKSSVVTRKQLKVEAGLIDTGYRGEIKVVLRNMSDSPVEISPGTAIAQMVLQVAQTPKLHKADATSIQSPTEIQKLLQAIFQQEENVEEGMHGPRDNYLTEVEGWEKVKKIVEWRKEQKGEKKRRSSDEDCPTNKVPKTEEKFENKLKSSYRNVTVL